MGFLASLFGVCFAMVKWGGGKTSVSIEEASHVIVNFILCFGYFDCA